MGLRPTPRSSLGAGSYAGATFCVGFVLALSLPGCHFDSPSQDGPSNGSQGAVPREVRPVREFTAEQAAAIEDFCSICHLAPRPEDFPRHAWPGVVERAYGFWVETGRSDIQAPVLADVVAFYQQQAPERLEIPVPQRSEKSFGTRFEREEFDFADSSTLPAVVHLNRAALVRDSPPVLVSCDMQHGEVRAYDLRDGASRLLGKSKNPCHSAIVDLDRDGRLDLLVADLGRFVAQDHREGGAYWFRALEDGAYRRIPLQIDVGRVADVQAADFDGDGDLDVVVAEFGLHKTGGVYWLETLDLSVDPPRFRRHDVDPRPGAIHVPIVDLNGDGKPDFLALMSQDYEEVLAWINQGDGTFLRQVVNERQSPSFGSSGITPTDFDDDGDLDLLYTNGDTFDNHLAKPYHGLQWLENRGEFPFTSHRVADMVGAFCAKAADFDGDGDQDLVLAGFLSTGMLDVPPLERHDSVVILEQTAPGRFARHSLSRGAFQHTSLEVADLDGDGRLDIAAGNAHGASSARKPRLVVWWNRGTRGASP